MSTRGLVAGADYGSARLGGIWGLYGSYDYFAPGDFRFSSTALSFGTTLQTSLTKALVLQGAFGDFDEAVFARLVEGHAAKRKSPEAAEGLASFAEKRAAKWNPKKG